MQCVTFIWHKHYLVACAYNTANTHAQGSDRQKSYSLVEGNQTKFIDCLFTKTKSAASVYVDLIPYSANI